MTKKTKKKSILPARVYKKHGAFYYVTHERKWVRLGVTLQEMHAAYYKLLEKPTAIFNMGDLIDRYMQEVAPTKAPRTYRDNQKEAANLKAVFQKVNPKEITPIHIYRYIDERSKTAPVRANREVALLSHMFTKGIRWGIVESNPCKSVERNPEKPRERYAEDWEFDAVYNLAPDIVQCIMDFAYLTCQRISDILDVKETDLTEEGIRVIVNKSIGKKRVTTKLLITWTDALRACVNRARNLRGKIRGLYLFCRRDGQQYTYDGFSSMWQRNMDKALKLGLIHERFTFHDIRAKSYSDEETMEGRRRAGHRSTSMAGTYDRGYRKVSAKE
jgi:integrase